MSAPCHYFLSAAGCRYAERCRFAHSTINPHDRALEGKQPPHQKLKTEACKFFNSPQGCRSGSNCGFQHIASFPAERRAFISEWSCPDNNCITLPLEEDGMYDFIVVSVLEFTRMIVFSRMAIAKSLCLHTHICSCCTDVIRLTASLPGQEWGDGHRDRVTACTQATHRYTSPEQKHRMYTVTNLFEGSSLAGDSETVAVMLIAAGGAGTTSSL